MLVSWKSRGDTLYKRNCGLLPIEILRISLNQKLLRNEYFSLRIKIHMKKITFTIVYIRYDYHSFIIICPNDGTLF